jgi:hypothetical protein
MTLAASRRSRLAIMGGLVLALAGTAIPSTTLAQDGPEKPVLSLFTAITEKRFADIGQSFCPEFAGQASQLDIAAAMTGSLPAGVDPQVAVDALAFSVTGPGGVGEPVITVLAEDAAGTSLGVEATLLASIDPATSEPFVRAIVVAQLEAAGMEVTEENIAAFMTLVASELEGMEAFSQTSPRSSS